MEQNTKSINFNVAYYSTVRIINIYFTKTLYQLSEGQPSPFYYFCEPVFLPDDGWNKQPELVMEFNKNLYTRST